MIRSKSVTTNSIYEYNPHVLSLYCRWISHYKRKEKSDNRCSKNLTIFLLQGQRVVLIRLWIDVPNAFPWRKCLHRWVDQVWARWGQVQTGSPPHLLKEQVSSGPWPGLVRSPFCQVGSGQVSISRAYRLTVSVRFQVFIWSCQVEVRWCPGGFRCPLSLFSSPNQVITKGCSSSYEMKESRGQDFVLTPLQVRFPWRCTSSDQILSFLQSSGSKFTLSLISNNDDCAEVEDGWLVFRLCSKSFFWRYSVHNDDVLIWWW